MRASMETENTEQLQFHSTENTQSLCIDGESYAADDLHQAPLPGLRLVDMNGDGFGLDAKAVSMATAEHLGTKKASIETTTTAAAGGVRVRSTSASADLDRINADAVVCRVWQENCDEVFVDVVDKLSQPRRRLHIALDLEFVAAASTDVGFRPFCWTTLYQHLRTLVNGGEMLQVGLALAFDLDQEQHGGAHAPSSVVAQALEINLRFDVDAGEYYDTSITFLADQGHCLAEYKERGVTTEQLVDGLLRHIPFGDESVTWVTFHGDNDFGFLLRLLLQQQQQQGTRRGVLPSDRAAFMDQVRQHFQVFYDVRVLGQLENEGWFTGKLSALAAHLGVERIGGERHAGSDALLTLACFEEIRRRHEHELHRLNTRRCLLSGMEELDMGIKCARHVDDASVTTVEVGGHNFGEEARRISDLVTSNFKTVGVDVQLLPQQDYYHRMKSSSPEGIDTFQVTIGFMNAEGMLAYGRVWKFHISSVAVAGGNNRAYVHPGQLACLMESCGATHNPNVAWVTFQGSHGIPCLIKSFVEAGDLPSDWCSYIEHQRGVFPNLYDVGLIAQGCAEIGKLPFWLGCCRSPRLFLF